MISIIEIIGIIATILILVAFMCNDPKKIRSLDALGALLFVVYGVITRTWSTAILNVALIIIQIVKLLKLR